jgi:hypothetical protein
MCWPYTRFAEKNQEDGKMEGGRKTEVFMNEKIKK